MDKISFDIYVTVVILFDGRKLIGSIVADIFTSELFMDDIKSIVLRR